VSNLSYSALIVSSVSSGAGVQALAILPDSNFKCHNAKSTDSKVSGVELAKSICREVASEVNLKVISKRVQLFLVNSIASLV
jgi:hypothetical protein